jgi:hypothetical protein
VSARDHDGRLVTDIRGAPKNLRVGGLFVSTAKVRFSPKLCEARYRLQFVFTTNKGEERKNSYGVRMRRGRLDGVDTRCPFAGLPRRGLSSMRVRVTIDENLLMSFVARPSTSRGRTFGRLRAPNVTFYRSSTPAGLARVWIRARYRSHRSHIVEFVADTDVAVPRG